MQKKKKLISIISGMIFLGGGYSGYYYTQNKNLENKKCAKDKPKPVRLNSGSGNGIMNNVFCSNSHMSKLLGDNDDKIEEECLENDESVGTGLNNKNVSDLSPKIDESGKSINKDTKLCDDVERAVIMKTDSDILQFNRNSQVIGCNIDVISNINKDGVYKDDITNKRYYSDIYNEPDTLPQFAASKDVFQSSVEGPTTPRYIGKKNENDHNGKNYNGDISLNNKTRFDRNVCSEKIEDQNQQMEYDEKQLPEKSIVSGNNNIKPIDADGIERDTGLDSEYLRSESKDNPQNKQQSEKSLLMTQSSDGLDSQNTTYNGVNSKECKCIVNSFKEKSLWEEGICDTFPSPNHNRCKMVENQKYVKYHDNVGICRVNGIFAYINHNLDLNGVDFPIHPLVLTRLGYFSC